MFVVVANTGQINTCMKTNDHIDNDWLRSQEVLQCIRDEFPKQEFTHFVSINPRVVGVDALTVERLVECGVSRIVDRLPQSTARQRRILLLREINGEGQIHYHGWLAAPDGADLPLDVVGKRWAFRAMSNYAREFVPLRGSFCPNIEICRIGEHPRGSRSTKPRTHDTAREYPLKVRTALEKHEAIIWG